jgi:hypothetical protein
VFSNSVIRGKGRGIWTRKADAACVQRQRPRQKVEQRGLPGTIWSDDTQNLALAKRQGHIAHDTQPAEILAQALRQKQRFKRCHRRPAKVDHSSFIIYRIMAQA